jgi:hypothetical protein
MYGAKTANCRACAWKVMKTWNHGSRNCPVCPPFLVRTPSTLKLKISSSSDWCHIHRSCRASSHHGIITYKSSMTFKVPNLQFCQQQHQHCPQIFVVLEPASKLFSTCSPDHCIIGMCATFSPSMISVGVFANLRC